MKIIYITGGARSGKSRYAEKLALKMSDHPIYIATSRIWDEDHKRRIEKHQNERDDCWITIEEDKEISRLELNGQVALLDCITLWLTNYFTDCFYDLQASLTAAQKEWDKFTHKQCILIVVSNEIGMGVHAERENTRKFVDLQGWMNQYIAKQAEKAILMVSGIPSILK